MDYLQTSSTCKATHFPSCGATNSRVWSFFARICKKENCNARFFFEKFVIVVNTQGQVLAVTALMNVYASSNSRSKKWVDRQLIYALLYRNNKYSRSELGEACYFVSNGRVTNWPAQSLLRNTLYIVDSIVDDTTTLLKRVDENSRDEAIEKKTKQRNNEVTHSWNPSNSWKEIKACLAEKV